MVIVISRKHEITVNSKNEYHVVYKNMCYYKKKRCNQLRIDEYEKNTA